MSGDDISLESLFGSLRMVRLRFAWSCKDAAKLPLYLGSSWRGLLGKSLRRVSCPFPEGNQCRRCLIREHCPYYCLYEKQSDLPGFKDIPRPYLLCPDPPDEADRRERSLEIVLLGEAVEYLPVVWQAFQVARGFGLGVQRMPFAISRWEFAIPHRGWQALSTSAQGYQEVPRNIALRDWLTGAPRPPWRFSMVTPLRLRRQGRYLSALDWPFFLASIAKRLEMLMVVFESGKPLGQAAWRSLGEFFQRPARIAASLHWHDWERYSSRQQSKVPMGGLVGELTLENGAEEWWPWCQSAALVNVGKGAAMGMGRMVCCR